MSTNVVSLDEWKAKQEVLGEPLFRVKVAGHKHHHLVRVETARGLGARGFSSGTQMVRTVALCGHKLALGERWARVVGKDPCCQGCQGTAARGTFIVRPFTHSKPL